MNDELKSLVQQAIHLKEGNKDFALAYVQYDGSPGEWEAHIGSRNRHVAILETGGQVEASATTPEKAVLSLIDKLGSKVARAEREMRYGITTKQIKAGLIPTDVEGAFAPKVKP